MLGLNLKLCRLSVLSRDEAGFYSLSKKKKLGCIGLRPLQCASALFGEPQPRAKTLFNQTK